MWSNSRGSECSFRFNCRMNLFSQSNDLGTTLTAKERKCCGELWTNFGLLTVSGAATCSSRTNLLLLLTRFYSIFSCQNERNFASQKMDKVLTHFSSFPSAGSTSWVEAFWPVKKGPDRQADTRNNYQVKSSMKKRSQETATSVARNWKRGPPPPPPQLQIDTLLAELLYW